MALRALGLHSTFRMGGRGLHRGAVSGPALVLGAIQPREPLKVLQQVRDWNTVSHRTAWSQDARWVLLRDLLEGPGAITPVPATGLQPDWSPQTCFLHPSSQIFGIFLFACLFFGLG